MHKLRLLIRHREEDIGHEHERWTSLQRHERGDRRQKKTRRLRNERALQLVDPVLTLVRQRMLLQSMFRTLRAARMLPATVI